MRKKTFRPGLIFRQMTGSLLSKQFINLINLRQLNMVAQATAAGSISAQSSSTQWDSHLLDISKQKHISIYLYIFHSHVHQFPGESMGRALALFSICWVWFQVQVQGPETPQDPGLNGLSAGDKHIRNAQQKGGEAGSQHPLKRTECHKTQQKKVFCHATPSSQHPSLRGERMKWQEYNM